jgi:hypothetical protein
MAIDPPAIALVTIPPAASRVRPLQVFSGAAVKQRQLGDGKAGLLPSGLLASDGRGVLWAVHLIDYTLDVIDATGEVLARYRRDLDWLNVNDVHARRQGRVIDAVVWPTDHC